MKLGSYFIVLAFVMAAGAGCSKKSDSPAILGKWHIIKDSTLEGIGPNPQLTVYIGHATDIWDFRADGKVYMQKAGSWPEVEPYTLYSANTIAIGNFGWVINGSQTISSLQRSVAGEMIIRSSAFAPPGGTLQRVVYLKR